MLRFGGNVQFDADRTHSFNVILAHTWPDDITGIEDQELAERAQQRAQQQGKSITVYDSIAIAMAAKAKAGDVKAAVFVRDSAGDKPADQMEITAEAVTDADRELMQNIQKRLQKNDNA